MVAIWEKPLAGGRQAMLAAIRDGLTSLRITGPSPTLEQLHREALEAVTRRPTRHERETALSQAWAASSQAARCLDSGNHPAAARAMDEMYSQVQSAISASRKD